MKTERFGLPKIQQETLSSEMLGTLGTAFKKITWVSFELTVLHVICISKYIFELYN